MSHDETPRPLDDLEEQLAALRPAASGINRDELLYAAGHAVGAAAALREQRGAVRSATAWLWPLATAASIIVAASFAALWWQEASRPAPNVVQSSPEVETEETPAMVSEDSPRSAMAVASASESYLHLRHVALSEGIDALPERLPSGGGAPPASAGSLLSPLLLGEG